jgi:ribosome-binding protein aMBF1 (putative translation factor)
MTQLASGFFPPVEGTSELYKSVIGFNDLSGQISGLPQSPAVSTRAPCRIYEIPTAAADEVKSEAFADFDRLVAEEEATAQGSAALHEARRWVGSAFYGERATLASLRLAAGLSQRQLADRCGLEQPHISRYESGRYEPKINTASSLAEALEVSLDVFVTAWRNSRASAEKATE